MPKLTDLIPGAEALNSSIKSLPGPSLDEAGQMMADQFRFWRWKSTMRLVEAGARIRKERGNGAKHVPLKTFLPLIEEASKEEPSAENELNNLWANLLGNATEDSVGIDIMAIDLIKRMGPGDAKVFLSISRFDKACRERSEIFRFRHDAPIDQYTQKYNKTLKRAHTTITHMGSTTTNIIVNNKRLLKDLPYKLKNGLENSQLYFKSVSFSYFSENVYVEADNPHDVCIVTLKRLGLIESIVTQLETSFDENFIWVVPYWPEGRTGQFFLQEWGETFRRDKDELLFAINAFILTDVGIEFLKRVS